MDKFCSHCGNKLLKDDKFCTKCGTPAPENEETNETQKVQETMNKLKESAENVSAAVKEKTKQAVQQSQEFIQSEQFQNAKNEAVKNTKNFIQRFFECNINNQEDFTRAELRRKRCLCVVFAMITASIFLLPFYDEYYWFEGLWYFIMKFASFLSSMSRILLVPVCIIALIKYHYANKEIKRYQSENPDVQTHDMRMNKKAMAITLVICIICVIVVGKINDIAYQNDYSDSSVPANSTYSSDSQDYTDSSEILKYQRDDDFIVEYAEKLVPGYNCKIEATDNYNRYIVLATAQKEYSHLTNQLIVYTLWINKNYDVQEWKRLTATNTNQKSRLISEAKEVAIWNSEPSYN